MKLHAIVGTIPHNIKTQEDTIRWTILCEKTTAKKENNNSMWRFKFYYIRRTKFSM